MNRGTGTGESPLGIALGPRVAQSVSGSLLVQAIADARAQSDAVVNSKDGSRPAGLVAAARVLMTALAKSDDAARSQRQSVTSSGQWSVMTGVAAALLVGALLLFAFHQLQEKLERRSNEQFRFPDVRVGRRLGAVQGGGVVAGITLSRKPQR